MIKNIFLLQIIILVCASLLLSSCAETVTKEEYKAATVKNISTTTITLNNGKSYAIPNAGNSDYTTLILTRHAEKESEGVNPTLTRSGALRAEKLSSILGDFQPNHIYTTSVRRSVLTVMPLAKKLKQPNVHYEPTDYYALFNTITEEHKAKKAVIVGHSNTIPAFLNLLVGEKRYEDMDETEYSNLYLVQTKGLGDSEVIELQY